MPIVFVLLVGAALAGALAQSPALQTQTPRALRAAYRFANHWLRILIGIAAIWPTVLISVALFKDSRIVLLVLTFVPIAVAIYAAIAIPPVIWAAPAMLNATLGGTSKVAKAATDLLPKKLRGTLDVPQVPTTKQLLWPIAAGLIGNCLLGLALYWVPIANDRELLFVLIIISIPYALLKIYNKAKAVRVLLVLGGLAIIATFFLGGRDAVEKKYDDAVLAAQTPPTPATQPAAQAPIPAGFDMGRWCPTAEKAPSDFFDREDIPAEFRYTPPLGCFGKLVLPEGWGRFQVQTAEPQQPLDRMAVSCSNGSIALDPAAPNTTTPIKSCSGSVKQKHTLLIQGNAELRFIKGD